jgi:hypothetical protein
MTEQEAKTKWCPMANIAVVGSHGYNRDTLGDPANVSYCIASDCMMWRKDPKYGDSYYCGLGGKP